MRAGEENLRPARFFAHIVDIGAHTITIAEGFAGDGFITPQQRFGAAQFHHQVTVFGALDRAIDDFTNAVLVFFELLAAFHFAHALDNHLLRGLRGDAAEINRRQRVHDEFAKLNARLDF